jgi:hypothetical protein
MEAWSRPVEADRGGSDDPDFGLFVVQHDFAGAK